MSIGPINRHHIDGTDNINILENTNYYEIVSCPHPQKEVGPAPDTIDTSPCLLASIGHTFDMLRIDIVAPTIRRPP
jgi:hypothetical protein